MEFAFSFWCNPSLNKYMHPACKMLSDNYIQTVLHYTTPADQSLTPAKPRRESSLSIRLAALHPHLSAVEKQFAVLPHCY